MMNNQLSKILFFDQWSITNTGIIRFKFYGEFDDINWIYNDCKDDMIFIGTSNKDGAPIFKYEFKGIDPHIIPDFKKLNLFIRKLKLKHYSKKELTKHEKSLFTFFRFFMKSFEDRYIKGLNNSEIKYVEEKEN